MTFERLNQSNVEEYIAYLKTAMGEEPDKMTAENVDEQAIRDRILRQDDFHPGKGRRKSGRAHRIPFLWLYAGRLQDGVCGLGLCPEGLQA